MSRPRDGQEASATVELAILLPVYMLLFVGALSIGHLMLIRQKVVEAVRCQAWLPDDAARAQSKSWIEDTFFGTYMQYSAGTGYTKTAFAKTAVRLDGPDYASCFQPIPGETTNAKTLALKVLQDDPQTKGPGGQAQPHLFWVDTSGKFTYAPDWTTSAAHPSTFFLALTGAAPSMRCTTYVRAPGAERKVLVSNVQHPEAEVSDHDPIEDYLISNDYFPISREDQATNRFFTPGAPDKDSRVEQNLDITRPGPIQASGTTPGIWDTGFRLQNERQFFHDMLY